MASPLSLYDRWILLAALFALTVCATITTPYLLASAQAQNRLLSGCTQAMTMFHEGEEGIPDTSRAIQGSAVTVDEPTGAGFDSLTVTGQAEPGRKVEVRLDGKPFATVQADSEGRWSTSIPESTPSGQHVISARSFDENDFAGPLSNLVFIEIQGPTVLDFDNDGFTDLALASISSRASNFQITRSSDGGFESYELPRGALAPGDYDGDGRWDPGTVAFGKRGAQWAIRTSSDGQIKTRTFGRRSSGILTGCRLISEDRESLAFFEGTTVTATELVGSDRRKLTFATAPGARIIGCADLSGDGIQELIFEVSVDGKNDAIGALGCSEDPVLYRTVKSFAKGGFVVLRGDIEFPIIGIPRPKSKNKQALELDSLVTEVDLPRLTLARSASVSNGTFLSSTGDVVEGLVIQNRRDGSVTRLLLDGSSSAPVPLRTGTENYKLLKPQNVYRRLEK